VLVAQSEGFYWNFLEFGRRIRFLVLHYCETRLLAAHFQSKEEPKVTWSEIRRVRCLGDDMNDFVGEKMLLNKQCVARCVMVVVAASAESSEFALLLTVS
jgi:hypothetical protein